MTEKKVIHWKDQMIHAIRQSCLDYSKDESEQDILFKQLLILIDSLMSAEQPETDRVLRISEIDWNAFMEFIQHSEIAFNNDSLIIQGFDGQGNGIKAQKDIHSNQLLTKIPKSAMLTVHSCSSNAFS